jgi:predicted nucleic acid-binding protein
MRYVLDASVATSWVLPYQYSPQANRLRDDVIRQVHNLISTSSFPGEVASALTKAERQKIITQGESLELLDNIFSTAPKLFPYQSFLYQATEISSRTRSSFYDCLLIPLAQQENCEVLTADDRLVRNVQKEFPFVRSIATY